MLVGWWREGGYELDDMERLYDGAWMVKVFVFVLFV